MQVVVRLSREIPTMEQIFMRNSFVLIVSAIIILHKRARCSARPSIVPDFELSGCELFLSPKHLRQKQTHIHADTNE